VTSTELKGLVLNGDNSGVEFKHDTITPDQLAREITGFLYVRGDHVLLGVENRLEISGLKGDPTLALIPKETLIFRCCGSG
jgi:ATP-dependent DNA helicase RecG